MTIPEYLRPFVVSTDPVDVVDAGEFDICLPTNTRTPAPVAVLVHGGPMREPPNVAPRQWPVFRGYAAALAARGIAAVMFDHALLRSIDYPKAAGQLASILHAIRDSADVDPDRVAIWFFSGGGPLAATVLRQPAPWLRTVALSYPMLHPLGPAAGFSPAAELTARTRVPILLTRAGLDSPTLLGAQQEFIDAAFRHGVTLTVIDVPDGHHAFDTTDDSEQSRLAIHRALDFIHEQLS